MKTCLQGDCQLDRLTSIHMTYQFQIQLKISLNFTVAVSLSVVEAIEITSST